MNGAHVKSPAGATPLARFVVIACLCAPPHVGAAVATGGSAEGGRELYRCCGLNCLAVVAHARGIHAPLGSLEQSLRPRENGECSVADIERAGRSLGIDVVCASVDWNTLPRVPFPCIVQLRSTTRYMTGSHYAILMGLHRAGVILVDAPNPGMVHPYDEFRKDWTGVVIAFPRDDNERREFAARIERSRSRTWAQWTAQGSTVALLGLIAWLIRGWRVAGLNQRGAISAPNLWRRRPATGPD